MVDAAQYLVYGVPAVAIVITGVKVARDTGLPSKYAPVTSLGLGVATGLIVASQNGDPWMAGVVAGVMIGASACGIYDAGKVKAGA